MTRLATSPLTSCACWSVCVHSIHPTRHAFSVRQAGGPSDRGSVSGGRAGDSRAGVDHPVLPGAAVRHGPCIPLSPFPLRPPHLTPSTPSPLYTWSPNRLHVYRWLSTHPTRFQRATPSATFGPDRQTASPVRNAVSMCSTQSMMKVKVATWFAVSSLSGSKKTTPPPLSLPRPSTDEQKPRFGVFCYGSRVIEHNTPVYWQY